MPLRQFLFAADWKEQVKPVLDKIQELNTQVPDWVGKTGLPVLDPMPPMNWWADGVLVLAALVLLAALWRLLTLRIFRAGWAVLAVLLIAYYPAAYGFHWFLFEHDKAAKAERADDAIPAWEKQCRANLEKIDYGIMGGGAFLGLLLWYLSKPGKKREYEEESVDEPQAEPAPWHQEQAQAQRQRRGGSGKNPFDFK